MVHAGTNWSKSVHSYTNWYKCVHFWYTFGVKLYIIVPTMYHLYQMVQKRYMVGLGAHGTWLVWNWPKNEILVLGLSPLAYFGLWSMSFGIWYLV